MKKEYIIALVVIAVAIVVGGTIYLAKTQHWGLAKNDPEQQVRDLVLAFGLKLKDVSLTAPTSSIVQAIQDNYAPFVSADILKFWKENPENAPGRLTSSPWPDRIEIDSVDLDADGAYEVQAWVIEMTSQEVANGGTAGHYQVALKVRSQNGKWVITGYQASMPL